MRTSSIRLATWMCVLPLAGCAQHGTAVPGTGGGVEEFEMPVEVSAYRFEEPPPDPNDPWAQPQQPEPWPWEQPQPAEPTTEDSAERAVVPVTEECPRGAPDFDSDGLCDSAEAKYGTLVQNPDTDGDALSDGMEVYGIEFQGRKLDLAALEANPLRRDVFLEIDYVQGYRPHQTAILRVVDAFAAAGVNLHAEVGQQIAVNPDIPVGEGEQIDADFKQPNLDPLKAFVYRWALFAHSYDNSGSSGIAPYEDTWLLVTLGNFTFKDEAERIAYQAGTLMHELGHTFNLRHGGIKDNTNFKPNHMSVMNYHYQFTGVWRDGAYVLDYSSYTVDGVSESLLSESGAFTPGEYTTEAHLARYSEPRICKQLDPNIDYCLTPAWLQGNLSTNLDFNGNETIDAGAVSVDLNGNGTTSDYFRPALEEWSRLGYAAGNVIGNLNPQVSRHVGSGELARCQSAPSTEL